MKTEPRNLTRRLGVAAASLIWAAVAPAQIIFTDNFDAGAAPQWSNLRGGWFTAGGVYDAAHPANIPPTFTGLPFVLQNFAVDVDINQVADGGIWLRCDPSGTNGVVLVTGGHGWGSGVRGGNAGRSLYWHVITGQNYNNPPILSEAFNVFQNPGVENVHLRVEVVGQLYSVFVNHSPTATTSLVETNQTYSSGTVGLYDFSSQTFDNVVLEVPPGFGPYPLKFARTGPSQATLVWTTNAVGWLLESATNGVTANWDTVTNAPGIADANFSLTIDTAATEQFFRLRRQ